MSPRTRLIVLVIIVTLLFAVTLLVRFLVPGGASSTSYTGPPGISKNSAMLMIAGLSPNINLAQLNCNGRRADRPITLTASQQECQLRISPDSDEPVRSAELSTDTANLTTYVVGEFEQAKTPKARRDKRTCLLNENELAAFRLVVKYEPRRDENPPEDKFWTCFLKQNKGDVVKIVALEKGGNLNLICAGCDNSNRQVILRLE